MEITNKDKFSEYYQAVKERDTTYIGSFYFGVKTTNVFCIPGCRARTPLSKNVVFYTKAEELLEHGYRPCKLCQPNFNAFELPADVNKALELFHKSSKMRVKDEELRNHTISPSKVRRYFNKHYGMSFQAYQRMYRINSALNFLKSGQYITSSAFDSGYDSLSGFGYAFKSLIGKEPLKSKEVAVINLQRITTPLGPMLVGASKKGICLLEFTDRRMLESNLKRIAQILQAPILYGYNDHINTLKKELSKYFDHKIKAFHVPIDLMGTEFELSYYNRIQGIEYGKTVAYADLASEFDCEEKEIRKLNGRNTLSILIPCHRIVSRDGKLLGYSGGVERKRWLLDFERGE